MPRQKLAAELLDAEAAGAPRIKNECFLFGKHLLLGQAARTAAFALQTSDAIGLIPMPPLAQCRPRNAAAAADKTRIAKLLVKPHPAKTRSGVHEPPHAADRSAIDLMNGACRPQLHSHNQSINSKAMDNPKATCDRSRKSETMSPNPQIIAAFQQ